VKKELNSPQSNMVLSFFASAYEDYIASRQLLINNLPVPACALANTSIEKYFKAMKAILGEPIPRHHDITVNKFVNTIKNKFKPIDKAINYEFIQFLSKAYKLRYRDEVEEGFNIVIVNNKTLAELDELVSIIESTFQIYENNHLNKSMYNHDKESNNPLLWKYNCTLNKYNKREYIEANTNVYEFRKIPGGRILSFKYGTESVKDDGIFNYEAAKHEKNGTSDTFTLCFKAIKD